MVTTIATVNTASWIKARQRAEITWLEAPASADGVEAATGRFLVLDVTGEVQAKGAVDLEVNEPGSWEVGWEEWI